jgi:hypothetical protein
MPNHWVAALAVAADARDVPGEMIAQLERVERFTLRALDVWDIAA